MNCGWEKEVGADGEETGRKVFCRSWCKVTERGKKKLSKRRGRAPGPEEVFSSFRGAWPPGRQKKWGSKKGETFADLPRGEKSLLPTGGGGVRRPE